MVGEDATSSQLEAPPLVPMSLTALDSEKLQQLADQVIQFTWREKMLTQWSWGEGVYLLAQVRYHEISQSEIPNELILWYRARNSLELGHVNNVAPASAAVRLQNLGLLDANSINREVQKWLADKSNLTHAANGAIEHWPKSVWADTCYMLGSYYINLAVANKSHELLKFMGDQLEFHIEILQHAESKLFAHGSYNGVTLWNFWGRGNAWMALSCVEYLDACEVLGIDDSQTEKIKKALKFQLTALLSLLPDYGIWDVLVDRQVENRGILETSASAGLGAALVRAARHFDNNKELLDSGLKVISASLTYINDSGMLSRTSAGTVLQLIPFGYSVIRNDRPQLWGQGLALNAITTALEPTKNQVAFT
ncbi:MAG: glycoside hydrolase family 88 protein [Actinomycetota bacterium]